MKINLFIGFVGILALLACKSEMPPLGSQWSKFEVRPDKEFQPIDSSRWSYPWYIVEYESGKFEHIGGNTIAQKDTTPIVHNSNCAVVDAGEYSWVDTLVYCQAFLKSDTLEIEIYRFGADGYLGLWIWVVEGKYKCMYKSSTHALGNDRPQIDFTQRELTLNRCKFKNGDNLKGKADVEWRHHFQNGKTEKRKIKGSFETTIGTPKEDPEF